MLSRDERNNFVAGADLPPNMPLSRASMIHVAQLASADGLITGTCTGTAGNLRIALRLLNLRTMKLGGELVANGPDSALPELENELAWVILNDAGLNTPFTRAEFKKRTRAIPNEAWSYFVRSLSLSDEDEQVKLLLKALESYPDIPEASYRVGRHYFQRGDWSKAITHLEKGRKRNQTYLESLFMLGTCYMKQDALADAIRSYSTVLSFARSAEALNNVGVAYLRRGDYTLATQNLVEAHNLSKSDPTVSLNLAIVRHLEGNNPAAQSILESTARSSPLRGILQYVLSQVLQAQGLTDAAAAALNEAVKSGIDPEKLKVDGPRSWTRLHTIWESRP
jgi:Flp pilus assembly protein TadD